MIIDNLTKFNQRKKMWMTPKHPLYIKPIEYRILYGAAVFMQAELDRLNSPLNNFELQRLLSAGFRLDSDAMSKVLRYSKENSTVIDYFLEHFETDREKYLLLLDMLNVSIVNETIKDEAVESVELFGKMFGVSKQAQRLLLEFAKAAQLEDVTSSRELLHQMHTQGMELSPVDMKYYIMQLWETIECNQQMLNAEREVRIVERCVIYEDLVLRTGMELVFDHAEVRIFGNILLEGGNLRIEDSKVIRKGDRHRACVNMKNAYSRITIINSEVDCRNLGMMVRAEAGELYMDNSSIYQTTRGAAIRFWGYAICVKNSTFTDCYSHEDGGALMIQTPNAIMEGCKFRNCEAKKGGAIFAIEGAKITNCTFTECNVAEYGAAIFYRGLVRANVHHLQYKRCSPSGGETVQYLEKLSTLQIVGEYRIMVSTVINSPLIVESAGRLIIENANIYLSYPIRCRGTIQMKNVKLINKNLMEQDMLILEHSKACTIHHCEFNGMGKSGGIYASGCRMTVTKSLFRNTKGGRAIYDAFSPDINECIFNFCQDGAVYAQNGDIKKSVFVNCRAKSGAGILMYGKLGSIEQCNFRRCISDFSGGAIDRALGQKISKCIYEDCKPDNIS